MRWEATAVTTDDVESILDTREVLRMLTPTQRRVVALLLNGHTRTSCARELGISPQAVHGCIVRVRRTLMVERFAGIER